MTPSLLRSSVLIAHSAVVLVALTTTLRAGLSWESTTQKQPADFGQEEIRFSFPFTNTGTAPITIEHVAASCGCTVASLAKTDYAPGESGVLEVVYQTDGQTGVQSKTVTVTTSDRPDQPVTLTLATDVPRLFDIAPRLVSWPLGEPAAEKRVTITLHRVPETTVNLLSPVDETIKATLQAGSSPGEHVLVLQPVASTQAFRALVRLRIASTGLPDQVLTVYSQVR